MFKRILITLLIIGSYTSYAQVSQGGSPVFFESKSEAVELRAERSLMALQNEPLIPNGPLRFAYPIFVNYSTSNSGEWFDIGGGETLWRLSLKSEGAKSLSLVFDHFLLLDDTQVFIYNKDKSHILGAFTSANNKSFGTLATSPVLGDEIIIELITKNANSDLHQLQIGEVYHDYIGVLEYLTKKYNDFGKSGDCNIDVNCDTELSEEVKRASCKILVNGFACSGTLVNNSNNDGTAYFLTAGHCVSDQSGAENAIVFFNFESPACIDSIAGADQQQISGANFIAGVESMDFTLLELSTVPPASYRPYWAGWDRAVSFSNPAYSIHHPEGDVKKISRSEKAPVSTTFVWAGWLTDNHWQVEKWVSGTTEGGSSGSGLFSSNDKLIGSLSGGEGSCSNPRNDYYARLNNAWSYYNGEGNESKQLAKWLDPGNTDQMSIDGFDLYNNEVSRVTFASNEFSPILKYSDDFYGSWSGNNERGYDGYAQYFYDYSSATLHGAYIIPAKCDQTGSSSINLKVWNSINSMPANVVFEENNITLTELKRREYLVDFQDPITVNGEFFIGIELNNPSATDTVALYNVNKVNGEPHAVNRAYMRDNGTWKAFNDLHPSGENGIFWVDFLGSDLELATELDTLLLEPVEIRPNPCRDGIVNYKTNLEHLSSVELYDLSGSLVKLYPREGEKEDQLIIPSSVNGGMYILVFKNPLQSVSRKVFIIR